MLWHALLWFGGMLGVLWIAFRSMEIVTESDTSFDRDLTPEERSALSALRGQVRADNQNAIAETVADKRDAA